MSNNKHSYKRRHYFVKKGFQSRFILKFCLIILAGVIISTGLLFLFSQDTLTSSFHQSRLIVRNTALAIFPSVLYTNLITLGLITIATIIVTVFSSHKIAGPMYRFEKELKEIEEGDLTKNIKLRSKDQITDMAVGLNKMVAGLHEKVFAIQSDAKQLLESASKGNVPEGFVKELNRLYKKIGSSFKI